MCFSLPVPDNGAIIFANDTISPFDYETTATYSCSTGFALVNGARVRTCVGSSTGPGEWSGAGPFCEGIYMPWTCMYPSLTRILTKVRKLINLFIDL